MSAKDWFMRGETQAGAQLMQFTVVSAHCHCFIRSLLLTSSTESLLVHHDGHCTAA